MFTDSPLPSVSKCWLFSKSDKWYHRPLLSPSLAETKSRVLLEGERIEKDSECFIIRDGIASWAPSGRGEFTPPGLPYTRKVSGSNDETLFPRDDPCQKGHRGLQRRECGHMRI